MMYDYALIFSFSKTHERVYWPTSKEYKISFCGWRVAPVSRWVVKDHCGSIRLNGLHLCIIDVKYHGYDDVKNAMPYTVSSLQ